MIGRISGSMGWSWASASTPITVSLLPRVTTKGTWLRRTADGPGESGRGRVVERERGGDLEPTVLIGDDDRRRFGLAACRDGVDEDLEAGPEAIDVGQRACAGDEDPARGVV
jgi:hypothetical protein